MSHDETPIPDASPGLPAPIPPQELASDPRKLAAVLATVLDQQSRDASANRAQARELIRAVEGLSKSHEFLGLELREERRRARALLAAVVFVPLAVIAAGALVAATVWGTDDRVSALERDVAAVRNRNDEARVEGLKRDFEERLRVAGADAEAARTDLGSTRAALDEERRVREAREARGEEIEARLAAMTKEQAELKGVRIEADALRQLAGAEKARADGLARALADAARPTDAATGPAAPIGAASGRSPLTASGTADGRDPAVAPLSGGDRPAVAPLPRPRPPSPDVTTASRSPGDLDRVRTKINSLLEGSTGAAKYEFETLGGVTGTDLLDVRVVGRDASGRVIRTVEARRAEIVLETAGTVRIRLADGHLVVAGRRAPFFDGTYTISIDGPSVPWRQSGLSCLRVQ